MRTIVRVAMLSAALAICIFMLATLLAIQIYGEAFVAVEPNPVIRIFEIAATFAVCYFLCLEIATLIVKSK